MRTTTHRNRSTLQTIRQVSSLFSLLSSVWIVVSVRHNRGHVTRGQFRQCLAIAGLPYTPTELESVEAAFIDDDGFGYRRFLDWIQTRHVEPFRYNILQQELKDLNKQRVLQEIKPLTSIQDILQKIKGQVKRTIDDQREERNLFRSFVVEFVCTNGWKITINWIPVVYPSTRSVARSIRVN